MPTLQIKIDNKYYNMACDEGQEQDLLRAVDNLNQRINKVYQSIPQATPDLALVVTALIMQDELLEHHNKSSLHDMKGYNTQTNGEEQVAKILDYVSNRIEELALKLEN